jgi:predicted DNA-binding ribbon-helix-helix protein
MKSRKLPNSLVVKRTITIGGRKTGVSLEDKFWEAFKEIAMERGMTLVHLATSIEAQRRRGNLSSAIRLFVLRHYQDQMSSIQTPRHE